MAALPLSDQLKVKEKANLRLMGLVAKTARHARAAEAEAAALRRLLAEIFPAVRPINDDELHRWEEAQAALKRDNIGAAFLCRVDELVDATLAMLESSPGSDGAARARLQAAIEAVRVDITKMVEEHEV
jgi:hypothetical protein